MGCSLHHPSPGQGGETAARGRILLVEDDPDAALFCTIVLSRDGRFEPTHTADPRTALTLAASRPWDLLITDLDLPAMSGIELIAAIRQRVPRLPVAMITSHPPDPATLPRESRPDAVLGKPVKADLLLATAAILITGKRQ
jgi:two-component system, NtrC family, response regulator HydG